MNDDSSYSSKKDKQSGGPSKRRTRARGNESTDSPQPLVNMDELRELIDLLRENGLAEFELETEGFRVRLRREGVEPSAQVIDIGNPPPPLTIAPRAAHSNQMVVPSPVHPGAQAETAASEDLDLHIIPSPIVGTFYRSPSPAAEAFVKIGSRVGPETVVCIIEAMKLMNEIQAETVGEVAKIYVENGQPVEYGQPLFGIKK